MQGAPESRRVSFRNPEGLDLVGDAWGREGDPPVVLLPGGGQTRHAWGGTARLLGANGWYALAMDLRGHGESSWSESGSYDLERFVDDLGFVAARLGQKPVVVGASLGGLTALLAVGGPTRLPLKALILVDIAPRMEAEGVRRIEGFMRAAPDGFESLEAAADSVARFLPHRPRPSDLSGLERNLRRGEDGRLRWHWDPRFMAAGHGPGLSSEDLLAAAHRVAIPTLLVRGRMSDVLSPEGVKEFCDAVPHSRFVDVAQAGHMVAGDRNDPFTDAVLEFLRETSAQ